MASSQTKEPSIDISDQHVSLERVREVISTLPSEDGWRAMKPLHLYQGFWCLTNFLENIIIAQQCFKAEPTDVFVCSFPKSGTTWLKALTFAIVTRARFDTSASPLLSQLPHDCIPNQITCFTKNRSSREPGLPLIASHAPYASLSQSVHDSDCKIVYICREPKDAFISMFHFVAKSRSKEHEPISLEEAFELFCEGKSNFGPFWDHILGFWKASLEKPEKVLFSKYEEMIEDPLFHVRKMAKFMGYPFSLEEEEQGLVEKIVEMCSFDFLSNLEVNKKGAPMHLGSSYLNNFFFRKGKVGDWKNHLTPQMVERIDKIIEQNLSGFGLSFGDPSK